LIWSKDGPLPQIRSTFGDPWSRLCGFHGVWYNPALALPYRFGNSASYFRWRNMKMVFAVIQPTKLDAVHQALERLDVTRMTVCDAQGYARQRGQLETYRGHEYKTNLLRKVGLEIAVNDDFVDRTVECLEEVARTTSEGHIGDGKIFVVPMEEAIQISDGYRGMGAI
jgi:nitrogen regulatory protein P-II 1